MPALVNFGDEGKARAFRVSMHLLFRVATVIYETLVDQAHRDRPDIC